MIGYPGRHREERGEGLNLMECSSSWILIFTFIFLSFTYWMQYIFHFHNILSSTQYSSLLHFYIFTSAIITHQYQSLFHWKFQVLLYILTFLSFTYSNTKYWILKWPFIIPSSQYLLNSYLHTLYFHRPYIIIHQYHSIFLYSFPNFTYIIFYFSFKIGKPHSSKTEDLFQSLKPIWEIGIFIYSRAFGGVFRSARWAQ